MYKQATQIAITLGAFLLAVMQPHGLLAQEIAYDEECLTNSDGQDRYASYSPDGKSIVFESDRGGTWAIYAMDLQNRELTNLTGGLPPCRRPDWHPNGTSILFEWLEPTRKSIMVLNMKSGEIDEIVQFPSVAELTFARYSPDGSLIACSFKESDDVSNIILLDNQGNIVRRLTNSNHRSYYPQWSPDGRSLVFFSRMETNNEDDDLYIMSLEDGQVNRLTKAGGHEFCPAWSHDGKYIVYAKSMTDRRPELFLMAADGSNNIRLTYNEDGETLPVFHPHEDKVLVTAYRNGNYEICELSLKF